MHIIQQVMGLLQVVGAKEVRRPMLQHSFRRYAGRGQSKHRAVHLIVLDPNSGALK